MASGRSSAGRVAPYGRIRSVMTRTRLWKRSTRTVHGSTWRVAIRTRFWRRRVERRRGGAGRGEGRHGRSSSGLGWSALGVGTEIRDLAGHDRVPLSGSGESNCSLLLAVGAGGEVNSRVLDLNCAENDPDRCWSDPDRGDLECYMTCREGDGLTIEAAGRIIELELPRGCQPPDSAMVFVHMKPRLVLASCRQKKLSTRLECLINEGGFWTGNAGFFGRDGAVDDTNVENICLMSNRSCQRCDFSRRRGVP
jgi:hypothetical protein